MKQHYEAPKIIHALLWSLAAVLAIVFVITLTLYLTNKVPFVQINSEENL